MKIVNIIILMAFICCRCQAMEKKSSETATQDYVLVESSIFKKKMDAILQGVIRNNEKILTSEELSEQDSKSIDEETAFFRSILAVSRGGNYQFDENMNAETGGTIVYPLGSITEELCKLSTMLERLTLARKIGPKWRDNQVVFLEELCNLKDEVANSNTLEKVPERKKIDKRCLIS